MKVRLVIPVIDSAGLNARVSQHFGRAAFFAVADLNEDGKVENIAMTPNTSEHFGGVGLPPDIIMSLKPNALITYGMGHRALSMFQNGKVAVLQTNKNNVKEVIEAYNKDELVELTEGCHHARHK